MPKINRLRPPTEIPDSAMADVAFLLLIFFIATTTVAEEFGLSLILPQQSTATQKIQVNRENVLVISTDESGKLFLVDEVVTPLEAIEQIVRDRQSVNDKLVISVEPHRDAPYASMVDILDELKQAGASRISLKSKRR